MKTALESIVQKLNEVEELASNIHGMEFDFGGNHAVLQYVNISDMSADLYIEYSNGDSDFLNIKVDELLKSF